MGKYVRKRIEPIEPVAQELVQIWGPECTISPRWIDGLELRSRSSVYFSCHGGAFTIK